MRHFPCQPLLEFSVFLYTAFKFRGRKEIEVYVKSPRKSANVCILPKTNSLESMTPNPLFFFLPLPLLLSKTAWLRDKFPCSQERKKNQKQKHFWTSSFKALLGSGHCVYCRAEWWRLSSHPQPLQQLGSAPKCAGLQLPAGEREIFRGISVCCRA